MVIAAIEMAVPLQYIKPQNKNRFHMTKEHRRTTYFAVVRRC